ncbi:hypothetical protein ColTof3_08660 [Colletotrichum tofieldiae]|nr:hypothetical protein ColTof3_08660 [Colletotrichum tofieldiae]
MPFRLLTATGGEDELPALSPDEGGHALPGRQRDVRRRRVRSAVKSTACGKTLRERSASPKNAPAGHQLSEVIGIGGYVKEANPSHGSCSVCKSASHLILDCPNAPCVVCRNKSDFDSHRGTECVTQAEWMKHGQTVQQQRRQHQQRRPSIFRPRLTTVPTTSSVGEAKSSDC